MPRSAAFVQLKESLSIADELLKIEKTNYHNPPRPSEQKPVQGLRGAAAVLVVAAFERFLRDAIEEHLTSLGRVPPDSFGVLPDDIRINSTYNTLEYAMKGGPYSGQKPKKDRLVDIDAACRSVLSAVVNPTVFSNTGGNPGPTTLKRMLNDCDINDIFGTIRNDFIRKWGLPIAQTFIPDKLDEIVQRRHIVAHTADALNITRTQLKESIRFLRILSELIDKEMEKKIRVICITAGIL